MDNLFFVEIRCVNTNRVFYARYDYAADDRWVLTRGVTSIPAGQSAGGGASSVDISNSRTGPQYKCPYCGNTGFVRHGTCGKLSCKKAGAKQFKCAYCNEYGEITGTIKDYTRVTKGHGQT